MTSVSAHDARQNLAHLPVMLGEVLDALAPQTGDVILDGTFGAGGYSRAILERSNCKVIAVDRDPDAVFGGQELVAESAGRLTLVNGAFSDMLQIANDAGIEKLQGIVLDIGVSSMQLDEAARGFSFMRDGPLDMRMSMAGKSAADVVAQLPPDALANLIFVLGDEPKSRAIARAIVTARAEQPILTTTALVTAIERATGPQRAHMRTHPATRTFQALRIYVNGELDQLAAALDAAEHLLAVGGRLVVVTFHSLEDRIVKRFFAQRSGNVPSQSRHVLVVNELPPASFDLPFKGHINPSEAETVANPRSRSAKLRAGIRNASAPHAFDAVALGVPMLSRGRH